MKMFFLVAIDSDSTGKICLPNPHMHDIDTKCDNSLTNNVVPDDSDNCTSDAKLMIMSQEDLPQVQNYLYTFKIIM